MDGLELVQRARSELRTPYYTYIILLTSRAEKKDVVLGLDAGADDYLTKPFDAQELRMRIKAGQRIIELESRLAEVSRTDELTQIANRRAFEERLQWLCEQGTRYGRPFGVVMTDIDYFKKYNDSLGHQAGDAALKQVAQILAALVRKTDQAFRYGGEEFVCLLPETSLEGAMILAERLRAAVADARIPHPMNPVGIVTISLGVAAYAPSTSAAPQLILGQADKGLYEAKAAGRNRVVAAQHPHS
jgi:diguanylate cyclase (GGDEF)-like protein